MVQKKCKLLGDPKGALTCEWLEVFYIGQDTKALIPWDFKKGLQLPTRRQVIFFKVDLKLNRLDSR